MINFFQRNKGVINIPGSSDIKISQEELLNNIDSQVVNSEYTVVLGDSLWKIAQNKYNNGYLWGEIAKANNIVDSSILLVGQKLVLPNIDNKQDSFVSNTISTGDYTVVKNDSLWKIAVRAYGDGYQWTKIWQENKLKLINPDELEIGMILTIPKL